MNLLFGEMEIAPAHLFKVPNVDIYKPGLFFVWVYITFNSLYSYDGILENGYKQPL